MRRTSGWMTPHEPHTTLGAVDRRRHRCALALLGRRYHRRLVARPAPAGDRGARTAGRRLPRREPPDPRPAVFRHHRGRLPRPSDRSPAGGKAVRWPDAHRIRHVSDADGFGNAAADAAGADANRDPTGATPAPPGATPAPPGPNPDAPGANPNAASADAYAAGADAHAPAD